MAVISMKQLLEAGVHFGHQTKKWNPKMGKYIYDARNEIEETLCFANAIPATTQVGEVVDFSVIQTNATVSYEIKKIASLTNAESAAASTTDYEVVSGSGNEGKHKFNTVGLFKITASAQNYAPWTTTVYVEAAT